MKLKRRFFIYLLTFFTSTLSLTQLATAQIPEELGSLDYPTDEGNEMLYTLIVILVFALLVIAYLLIRTRKIKLQHKHIEEQKVELASTKHQYLEIFDFSLDSIITTHPEGKVTSVNVAAEEMLGYSSVELIGKNIKMVYASEDDLLKVFHHLKKYDQYSGEILNKTKDGKILITKLSTNQIRNPEGDVIGTMGISRDITTESILKKEYDSLINNVSDIIYTADISGNFTYTNRPVESILGYSSNEILNSSFRDLIHKDDLEMVGNHFVDVFKSRKKKSYLEFKVKTKDENYVWVGQQVNTKFDKSDSSRIEGYFGIVRVIDERKRAELRLQGSEKKYRDLIDNSSDLIQVIDGMGKIMFVNEAWKRTLKYTEKDLEELSMFSIIHEDSMQHCTQLFESILHQEKAALARERVLYSLVSKDGEEIRVEGSFNVTFDDDGKVESIQSFLRDVTLQKDAEEQLAQKESTLRQITETISDVFYLYNIVEQKYEYISPNCEETMGANQQFFYDGRSHTQEFGHPEDIKLLTESKSNMDEGQTYDINFRIVVDGETRWINEKSFPIRDEGGSIIANSGICRDVTEIRTANEIIKAQNAEIGASILYAKRIQDAVLPTTNEINALLPDSLVLSRPKDVVSGDFYIVEKIQSNEYDDLVCFVVGDCTGHGVPGAVLSLMCNVLIRESFKRHDVNSPAQALDYVRRRLTMFFSSTGEKNIRDGMDIAFCAIDFSNNEVHFAGANSNCIFVRDGQLEVLRGSRQHVGYDENPQPFENHTVEIKKGDRIYLYSDGYTDQFGGENNKKFGKPKLHNLLEQGTNMPMIELGKLLNKELDVWQGDGMQIDDITILGVEV
ncbi:MAG: PAS domain S-box protein [Crocinitomicaceae bacterium]|nr:PAS domain S-box protein [Crocinitomicaceae bacterium]